MATPFKSIDSPRRREARRSPAGMTLFYDGSCALCHGLVRFILMHDRRQDACAIRVAPLQGSTAAHRLAHAQPLPDSVILLDETGQLFTRSTTVWRVLDDLGGRWRILAWGLWLIPWPIRDAGYDMLARLRSRLMKEKTTACPMLPPELQKRVLP